MARKETWRLGDAAAKRSAIKRTLQRGERSSNAQTAFRYGGSPGRASGDGDSQDSRGSSHTIDST
jgi:hypothetical protein